MSVLSKKYSFHEVFDSQKMFRLILDAMANPATAVNIKEYAEKMFGEYPAFLAVAMTLLDNEVSFNTCENGSLSDEIICLTLAKGVELAKADFVFVCESIDLKKVIESVKCGTLAAPHKSATVIIRDEVDATCNTALYGPGIDVERMICVSNLVRTALQLRDKQFYEYPQGIDLLFVTGNGELFAIPRLVRWEVR